MHECEASEPQTFTLLVSPFSLRAKRELMQFVRYKGSSGRSKSFVCSLIKTIENTFVQRAGRANSNSHGSSLKNSTIISQKVSWVSLCSRTKTAGQHP